MDAETPDETPMFKSALNNIKSLDDPAQRIIMLAQMIGLQLQAQGKQVKPKQVQPQFQFPQENPKSQSNAKSFVDAIVSVKKKTIGTPVLKRLDPFGSNAQQTMQVMQMYHFLLQATQQKFQTYGVAGTNDFRKTAEFMEEISTGKFYNFAGALIYADKEKMPTTKLQRYADIAAHVTPQVAQSPYFKDYLNKLANDVYRLKVARIGTSFVNKQTDPQIKVLYNQLANTVVQKLQNSIVASTSTFQKLAEVAKEATLKFDFVGEFNAARRVKVASQKIQMLMAIVQKFNLTSEHKNFEKYADALLTHIYRMKKARIGTSEIDKAAKIQPQILQMYGQLIAACIQKFQMTTMARKSVFKYLQQLQQELVTGAADFDKEFRLAKDDKNMSTKLQRLGRLATTIVALAQKDFTTNKNRAASFLDYIVGLKVSTIGTSKIDKAIAQNIPNVQIIYTNIANTLVQGLGRTQLLNTRDFRKLQQILTELTTGLTTFDQQLALTKKDRNLSTQIQKLTQLSQMLISSYTKSRDYNAIKSRAEKLTNYVVGLKVSMIGTSKVDKAARTNPQILQLYLSLAQRIVKGPLGQTPLSATKDFRKLSAELNKISTGFGELEVMINEVAKDKNLSTRLPKLQRIVTSKALMSAPQTRETQNIAKKLLTILKDTYKLLIPSTFRRAQPATPQVLSMIKEIFANAARIPAIASVNIRRELQSIYATLNSGIIIEQKLQEIKRLQPEQRIDQLNHLMRVGGGRAISTPDQGKAFARAILNVSKDVRKGYSKSPQQYDLARRKYASLASYAMRHPQMTRYSSYLQKSVTAITANLQKKMQKIQKDMTKLTTNYHRAQMYLKQYPQRPTGRMDFLKKRKWNNAQKTLRTYQNEYARKQQELRMIQQAMQTR